MTTELILREIKKGFTAQDKAFLLTAYRTVFGKDISNPKCSSCLSDAYYEIRHYLKTNGLMKPIAKEYTVLRANIQINGLLSHEMSDEQIAEYIKKDPKNAKFYFKKGVKIEENPAKTEEKQAKNAQKDAENSAKIDESAQKKDK